MESLSFYKICRQFRCILSKSVDGEVELKSEVKEKGFDNYVEVTTKTTVRTGKGLNMVPVSL